MSENSTTELLRKLVTIGTLLGSVSLAFDMGPSTFETSPVFWTVSDASTFQPHQAPSSTDLDLAMVEVRAARSILSSHEVKSEAAFQEYLAALDVALDAYDASESIPGREVRLATALAVARTALSDDVALLASWLAIAKSAGQDGPVPTRFGPREAGGLEHSDTSASLSRTIEDATEHSEAADTLEATRQSVATIQSALDDEPIEDGISHRAEDLAYAHIKAFGESGLLHAVRSSTPASRSAAFLRLLGRLSDLGPQLREELVTWGLAASSVEVRDAAIQAVENWADRSLVALLRDHQEPVGWLRDYAADVVGDLEA